MHLLESYSLSCGAKIDKPYVYKNFFPIPFEKYIIFCPNFKVPAKEYNYFQDVINMIFPFLEKNNIKIVQISQGNNIQYDKVINLNNQITLSQTAYLISNAMLFFGCDGYESQIAGAENIPMALINSISYFENTGPFFGSRDKQKRLESFKKIGNQKASFNGQENPKSINLIKPEEIANSIFESLNINFKIPFESHFFGKKYSHNSIQEVVPNSKNMLFHPESIVEIRADEEYDEEAFLFLLSNYKKSIIVTDKEINLDILFKLKPNIQMFVFKVKEKNYSEYLNKVKNCGINVFLISDMSEDQINKEKINYYEFGNIHKVDEQNKEIIESIRKEIDIFYYRSAKITSSKNNLYYSMAAKNKNIPLKNTFEYQKVIDTPEFWNNLDFFTIVKIKG